jgi:hypothetical protein
MNRSLPIVILCLAILYSAPARGDDLVKAGQACCDTPHGCLPPRIPGCPDDYCRKPLPSFCWPMLNLSCVSSYFKGDDGKRSMTKR